MDLRQLVLKTTTTGEILPIEQPPRTREEDEGSVLKRVKKTARVALVQAQESWSLISQWTNLKSNTRAATAGASQGIVDTPNDGASLCYMQQDGMVSTIQKVFVYVSAKPPKRIRFRASGIADPNRW